MIAEGIAILFALAAALTVYVDLRRHHEILSDEPPRP